MISNDKQIANTSFTSNWKSANGKGMQIVYTDEVESRGVKIDKFMLTHSLML